MKYQQLLNQLSPRSRNSGKSKETQPYQPANSYNYRPNYTSRCDADPSRFENDKLQSYKRNYTDRDLTNISQCLKPSENTNPIKSLLDGYSSYRNFSRKNVRQLSQSKRDTSKPLQKQQNTSQLLLRTTTSSAIDIKRKYSKEKDVLPNSHRGSTFKQSRFNRTQVKSPFNQDRTQSSKPQPINQKLRATVSGSEYFSVKTDSSRLQKEKQNYLYENIPFKNTPNFKIQPGNNLRQSNSTFTSSLFKNADSLKKYEGTQRSSSKSVTRSTSKPSKAAPVDRNVGLLSSSRFSKLKIAEDSVSVSVADFQIGKCKGDGKFGKVYPCRHKLTGSLYALKQIPKQLVTRHMMQNQMVREIKLHSFFNHSNIVKMYSFFHDSRNIYILMEYMQEGALYNKFKKHSKLPETYVAGRIKEICSAIKYLHELDVAHRDIKLQNIVLSNGVAKLCDFGWAALADNRRTTYCGTFDYTPPEIIEGKDYNKNVDLWSLGVMTYELIAGQVPFYHISRSQTMNRILNVDKVAIKYPAQMSAEARDFIGKLLRKEPTERMAAQKLLEHPFLTSVKEFIL